MLDFEDPVKLLNPEQMFLASDLLVWKHLLNGIQHGFLPQDTCLPNPLLPDDLVVASTCSPGSVCALDKETGERRWMHNLSYYGQTPISSNRYLFGGTSQSLLSLSPETGKTVWEFAPYGGKREYIYSLPVYSNESVFIGDRHGVFYCLSAKTGKVLWSVETSRARNSDVNATALAFENLIITANKAKLVLAYNQESGKEVWRRKLADRSGDQIQLYNGLALVRKNQTLYAISPLNGKIIQKWSWRGKEISSVTVAESLLCVVVTNEPGVRGGKMPAHPCTELLGIEGDSVKWRLPYPRYTGVALRWDAKTGFLYESMYNGLGIVDPIAGRRVALIQGFAQGYDMEHVGLPSMDSEKLYLLDCKGTIWALRHPIPGNQSGLV